MRKHAIAVYEQLQKQLPVFQVISGPRQVGKTTAAKQIAEKLSFEYVYATADSAMPLHGEWIETQWAIAEQKQKVSQKPVLLILDEIQKVQGWSEVVKGCWDQRRYDIRLLVLGSSALLLQTGLCESLAGRFYLNRFPHWSFEECRKAFGWDLDQWLYFGGYPGGVVFAEDDQAWRSYINDSLIEAVLSKDVLQLQPITKPALMRNLFGLAATFPAQIFSYNKMLGQLLDAGNTTTLAHYLHILGDAYLVSGLELFSRGQIRKRGSSPKLILWNNALINGLSLKSYEQSMSDVRWRGRLVENAVGGYLLNALAGTSVQISYWRKGPQEVDFVLSNGEHICALEVKSGCVGKTSGMSAFKKTYPEGKALLIGRNGIPLEDFLSINPVTWLT